MYQNMMGQQASPFGGPQVNGTGELRTPAPRPMPMPMPNTQMTQDYRFTPGYSPVQPGGVEYLRGQFGGGMPNYSGGGWGSGNGMRDHYFGGSSPWGAPVNNDWAHGPTIDSWHNRPTYGGFNPQPDGGSVQNPDMQNPFRTFNNGNPFYNAKGNLRMRYRPGGQMGGAFAQGRLAALMQPGTDY